MRHALRSYLIPVFRFAPTLFALTAFAALLAALLEGAGTVALLRLLGLLEGRNPDGVWARSIPFMTPSRLSPLLAALLLFVIAIGMRSLMIGLREYLMARLQLGFANCLRLRLFDALCFADWARIAGRRRSTVLHTLSDDVNRVDQGIQSLIQSLAAGFMVVVQLSVASLLSVRITLLVLGTMLLWLCFVGGTIRNTLGAGTLVTRTREHLTAAAADAFYALKRIKSQALEQAFRASFSDHQRELERRLLRHVRTSQLSDACFQLAAAGAVAFILWLATQRLHFGLARTAVLIVIFARLAPLISSLVQSCRQVLFAAPACSHVLEMTRELEGIRSSRGSATLGHPWQTIRFDGVGLRYGEGQPWIFRHLDLCIRANSTTVVFGPSGSGKTTLIDLLVGLLCPSAGRILIDGVPLQSLDPTQWTREIAYVVQDGMLWDMSIRDNLTFGLSAIDDTQIAHALQSAGAAELVAAAERGIDSPTGERGERFSGGERQRLAFAQALLRHPRLLVLDEPSSALDAGSIETLRRTLTTLHGQMTIVIATHDTRFAALADQTLDLSATPSHPVTPVTRKESAAVAGTSLLGSR